MKSFTRSEMALSILAHNNRWNQAIATNAEGQLVNNVGTVRYEDFQQIEETVVTERRLALNGIADLMSAGLSRPADITQMLAGFENINEFQEAKVSMNPEAEQNNQIDYVPAWVPLPIVHQDWRIPFRQAGFSYKNQQGANESVRQVGEKLEQILFQGNTDIVVNFNGANQVLYGYTNHPDRQTQTIADWTDPANRATIISNAIAMLGKMYNNAKTNTLGLVLYVATDIWTNLAEDYNTSKGDKTILERLLAIPGIGQVKPSISLPAGQVVMVQLASETISLHVASDIVTIPHTRDSDISDQVFTTYAAMTPQIKSSRNGLTGIVHGSV